MTAALLQSELRSAFAPTEAPREEAPPATPVELAEILKRFGRIDAAAAGRIAALQKQQGRSFAWAAGRLKLASPDQVNTAAAMSRGLLRDDRSAFALARDLVVVRRPQSTEAERFRHLRTHLITSQSPEKLNAFAVAPAGAGRGTYVAMNLATALAFLKRRVVLIDADLRRPTIRKCFGLPAAECGTDFDRPAEETSVCGLSVFAAGEAIPDAQERLAGDAFRALVNRCRRTFDITIVLAAPFDRTADAQFVFAETKSVIVVARRHETRAKSLVEIGAALRRIGAETLGAVLTD